MPAASFTRYATPRVRASAERYALWITREESMPTTPLAPYACHEEYALFADTSLLIVYCRCAAPPRAILIAIFFMILIARRFTLICLRHARR